MEYGQFCPAARASAVIGVKGPPPGFSENTSAVWMVGFHDGVLAVVGGESMTIRYQ